MQRQGKGRCPFVLAVWIPGSYRTTRRLQCAIRAGEMVSMCRHGFTCRGILTIEPLISSSAKLQSFGNAAALEPSLAQVS